MNFKNKNIVVTGATSGIGLSLVERLVAMGGCRVCAIGRDGKKLRALKKKYGDRIYAIQCDLKIGGQVDEMFVKLFTPGSKWSGKVDIFIANAGMAYYEKLEKADWAHMESIYALNTVSPVYCLMKMQEYANGRKFQYAVVISGVAKVPLPGYALYSSTKTALDGFLKAYDFEKNRNVILSAIYPVAVKTPFYNTSDEKMNIPLLRQTMNGSIRRILSGIRKNKRVIYPSLLLPFGIWMEHYIPVITIYLQMEKWRLNKWMRRQKT